MKHQCVCLSPDANLRFFLIKQIGVASIEYALIAALIAVAIIGALQVTGLASGGIWSVWTTQFIAAINSVIGP